MNTPNEKTQIILAGSGTLDVDITNKFRTLPLQIQVDPQASDEERLSIHQNIRVLKEILDWWELGIVVQSGEDLQEQLMAEYHIGYAYKLLGIIRRYDWDFIYRYSNPNLPRRLKVSHYAETNVRWLTERDWDYALLKFAHAHSLTVSTLRVVKDALNHMWVNSQLRHEDRAMMSQSVYTHLVDKKILANFMRLATELLGQDSVEINPDKNPYLALGSAVEDVRYGDLGSINLRQIVQNKAVEMGVSDDDVLRVEVQITRI